LWQRSIDGSTNYLVSLPLYAISIAYREGGVFRLGVVYDPSRDELFSAVHGQGAQLNGESINVDREGEGEDIYEQSIVSTDWPGEGSDLRVDCGDGPVIAIGLDGYDLNCQCAESKRRGVCAHARSIGISPARVGGEREQRVLPRISREPRIRSARRKLQRRIP
jgi:hypothetical protein